MIKANELVWKKLNNKEIWIAEISPFASYVIDMGVYYHPRLIFKDNKNSYGISELIFETLEEAKAACQAHYQQMVERMVNIEHLKQIIRDAIEYGFNAGVYFESEQEAFAKTTREPYKTPKEHVRSLFEKFLKKMEAGSGE